MIIIKNRIDLKSFEAEFKKIFHEDKLYVPILKEMATLFRTLEPNLLQSDKTKEDSLTLFKANMIETHKAFADQMNALQKAFNEQVNEQQRLIETRKIHDQMKLSEVSKALKLMIEHIDKEIQTYRDHAESDIQKAIQLNQRDNATIQKIMAQARKKYIETTEEIVKEYHLAIEQNQLLLEEKKQAFDHRLSQENAMFTEQKEEIAQTQKIETDLHDENYVSIKTNYSKLSISINKKISEITKKYNQAVSKKKAVFTEAIKPTENSIQALKDEYQVTLNTALNAYTEKFNALNHVFDAQKEKFEERKAKMIHEGHEAITVLNSKLSSYKEALQKEKNELTKVAREEASMAESPALVEDIQSKLNQKIRELDAELNKQILRTNKDILAKKRDSQIRVFELELKHLKEINDWRANKAIIELEKKQEFSKIEMNFKHNLLSLEHALKKMEAQHQYQLDVLKLAYDYDLASMEGQLMMAQSVQERDLNLLANDALLSIENAKHQEKMIQLNHEKLLADIQLERDLEVSFRESNRLVLDTTSQLELEKEKLKRDLIIHEQEFKKALSDALMNRSIQQAESRLKVELIQLESRRQALLADHKLQMDEIKALSLLDQSQKHHHITTLRFDTQQAITHLKIDRSMKTYTHEINALHTLMDGLFTLVRHHQAHHREVIQLTQTLYELPCHPEIFKHFLALYKDYSEHLLLDVMMKMTSFESYARYYYIQKSQDQTGIHFSTKQEETLHYYQQEKYRIEQNIRQIDDKIGLLEADFIRMRNDIDHQQLFINQLKKVQKSGIQESDTGETHILIQNHHKNIQRLNKDMKLKEKELNQAFHERQKYLKENEQVDVSQKAYMDQIEKENQDKSVSIIQFVHINQTNSKKLVIRLMNIQKAIDHFLSALKSQVYVSTNFMNNEMRKLMMAMQKWDRILLSLQQSWMNAIMRFYQKNMTQQMVLLKQLNRSVHMMKETQKNKLNFLEQSHHNKWKQTQTYHKNRLLEIRNDQTKQLSLEQSQHQKKMQDLLLSIKQIESKIAANNQRQKNEIDLVNENQVDVAIHYKETHEQTIKTKQDQHQKQVDALFNQVQTATKNQLNLYHSIEIKNEALLARQEAEQLKIKSKLKAHGEHYQQNNQKSLETYQQKETLYAFTIKESYQNREHAFAKIKAETKKEKQTITKEQHQVYRSEAKILKKAHSSKMKMLHLN